jgi:hypothetical protein
MLIRVILVLLSVFLSIGSLSAAWGIDNNVREVNIGDSNHSNEELDSFIGPVRSFFFSDSWSGSDGILWAFTTVAFQIKNFFIGIAILFLIVGILKLLFSSSDEENVKKWRSNIVWTSVGIFVMQISFSVWNTLILKSSSDIIGSSFGWDFWVNIFAPIVNLLQMLAAFGFLFMAVWAFFMLVTAWGDEEKAKKAKNTILYAIVGFLLIRIPYSIVKAFYGRPGCENSGGGFITLGTCDIKSVDLSAGIGIIWKIFTYFNTFLSVICVILIVYAGWLVLISGGEEEKLKKAKNIILYIVIGFVILVASHAIFRFFILKG